MVTEHQGTQCDYDNNMVPDLHLTLALSLGHNASPAEKIKLSSIKLIKWLNLLKGFFSLF